MTAVGLQIDADADLLEMPQNLVKLPVIDAVAVAAAEIHAQVLELPPLVHGECPLEDGHRQVGEIRGHPGVAGACAGGATESALVRDLQVEGPDRRAEEMHG